MDRNRAYIYCRVGHNSRNGNDALKMQEARLEQYAAKNNLAIVGRASDTDSGLTLDRPSLRKIQRLAAAREIDVLLLVNLSRLARGTMQAAQFLQALWENGVRVCTIMESSADLSHFINVMDMLKFACTE